MLKIQAKKPNGVIDYARKKFLIIEDFASFRSILKRILESYGATTIDETANGEDGISKMALKKYDVILCDYNLGDGKDGQQVLEEAKVRGLIGISTIFVMCTAENTMEQLMGALEYQPDDYLLKPFNRVILNNKLSNLFLRKENLQKIEQVIVSKDYDRAIALCNNLIDAKPRNLRELLKLKGELLLTKGDYDGAFGFYQEVLAMGNLPWAALGLGKVKFARKDYAGAKDIFEKLIQENDKITSAYDWLAKTLDITGDPEEAQHTLMKAVAMSPKAILRQKALGDIACKNQDYDTAKHSLKAVVAQGKNSYLKSSSDYTKLAKVLIDLKDVDESVAVLDDATSEFSRDKGALLNISLAKCRAYKEMNDQDGSKKALATAVKLAEDSSERLPRDVEIELTKACFLAGDEQKGAEMMRSLVQNSHDDEALVSMVKDAFRDIGMEESAAEMMETARTEIYDMNNEGVRLVREGDLDRAVAYFERATEKLKENKIINANAALAYILHMKKNGRNDEYAKKARLYVTRVQDIDPSYKDIASLQNMLQELTQEV